MAGRVVGRRQRSGRWEGEEDGVDCGGGLLVAEGGLARMIKICVDYHRLVNRK